MIAPDTFIALSQRERIFRAAFWLFTATSVITQLFLTVVFFDISDRRGPSASGLSVVQIIAIVHFLLSGGTVWLLISYMRGRLSNGWSALLLVALALVFAVDVPITAVAFQQTLLPPHFSQDVAICDFKVSRDGVGYKGF